jgi:hypothetical protein
VLSLGKRSVRHLSRILPALLTVGLAAYVLRSADLERALGLVRSLGWTLPLLLVPNLVVTLIEAVAWWLSFSRIGPRPPLAALVRVRLAVEATMLGLPSGAVVSESLQPYLLRRRCGTPFETAVVAGVGRKFFVVVSHGLVLAMATLVGWPLLVRVSRDAIGRDGLPWLVLATSIAMTAAFVFGVVASARGRVAARVRVVLDRLFGRWLGSWLERHAPGFDRADRHLVEFFTREPGGLVAPLLLYMAGWVVRGVETFVFLLLLGVSVSLTAATVMETALILVRSVAVPVPAGLGVQDVGYVLSLRALGVPDATTVSAAFVLMKRGKDLFWILVGFLLLGLGGTRGSAEAAGQRAAAGEGISPVETSSG